ncbi:hypothetical protein GCM10023311_13150 [Flaviramulus aquimarinus]|uniref:Uncharacterized protein n=1 Tax=Flaviramulus aquimarinus TaxID=1170456 RepID=A0ABP9EZ36_9FLAO
MKFKELIEELKSVSDRGVFTRGKIDWWLLKHEDRYNSLSSDFDLLKIEFPKADIDGHKLLTRESEFLKLYNKLLEVSEKHRNGNNYQELIDLNNIIKDIQY